MLAEFLQRQVRRSTRSRSQRGHTYPDSWAKAFIRRKAAWTSDAADRSAAISAAVSGLAVSGTGSAFAGATGFGAGFAVGVAVGVALGTFRIVTGTPLHWYIIVGYVIVIAQTMRAPKAIIPLAYDSGGVTTSTVTVPLVAALGLGLADTIPGRSPLLDGFGLIAFASLFPMISVMAYAQISDWRNQRARRKNTEDNA